MRFFTYWANFARQDTRESSTRLCAILYALSSITYAFRKDADPIVLAQLIAAAALFAGLRKSTEPTP
jgi:hypothetical protein